MITKEQFLEIKELINGVADNIPPNKIHPIWNAYNLIRSTNESVPCTCSPKRWVEAVNSIRAFIIDNEERISKQSRTPLQKPLRLAIQSKYKPNEKCGGCRGFSAIINVVHNGKRK